MSFKVKSIVMETRVLRFVETDTVARLLHKFLKAVRLILSQICSPHHLRTLNELLHLKIQELLI